MNSMMIGVVAFFGAASLGLLAAGDFFVGRLRVNRGLRTVRAIEIAPADVGRVGLAVPLPRRVLVPRIQQVARLTRRLTPAKVVERLDRELAYAGQPVGWDAERMFALKILATGAIGGGSLVFGLAAGFPQLRTLIFAAVLGFCGYMLPDIVLRSHWRPRQDEIRRALADSLDLLSVTVEAGLGFDAALTRVAREVAGPLGQELNRMLQEMQLGMSRSDAFRDLAERTTVPECKSFALAMVQADVFGISVAKVLHVQAREMRIKRRQVAEEKAMKLPVKILFPLLFCIFPALFVVLLGPAAIKVSHSLIGHL